MEMIESGSTFIKVDEERLRFNEITVDSTSRDDDDDDDDGTNDVEEDVDEKREENHRNELKRPDLKGSFRCSICSKVFCHSSSLSRHRMQAHFKSYKCTVCRKDISNSDSLRTHMFKSHHISRMYMCRCCNWAFPDKSLLHVHLQTTSDPVRHSVINRRCDVINDPYQFLQSTANFEAALLMATATSPPCLQPTPSETSTTTTSWMPNLPKPIPTTTPLFLTSDDTFLRNSSQSPTCSSVSFKSDSNLSAFHQLNADPNRNLISSPINMSTSPSASSSPQHDCFDCQILKTKLTMAENKCKYLESRSATLQTETIDAQSQASSLELTVQRLKLESKLLRDHNEIFQRKLLECQQIAVEFLQTPKLHQSAIKVQEFVNHLVNSTILTS